MSEKIDEFSICQPLNAVRRKALEKMIDHNAPRISWPVSYVWDEPQLLVLTTGSVEWEVVFHAHKIEIFAEAPFWARMLLTKSKRQALHEICGQAIQELGFFAHPKEKAPAKPRGKAARKK